MGVRGGARAGGLGATLRAALPPRAARAPRPARAYRRARAETS